ncbi:hypothetical protein ROJ8625_01957 [Roseivivax jejudonensis]|uniref:ATP-dependent transcriptional regulator n=1 Tax=Roseivivax jejudonensis TaxID=1529041 RepID=A0A1X6Z551_9RHOB|nr:DUF2927 domain-containing protein [Roseivivax jejudonensis]SLN41173.1 hypothetical protein ROJ8625_01957 [Roseivivax jejudonensis]
MRRLILCVAMALTACTPTAPDLVPEIASRAAVEDLPPLPPVPSFAGPRVGAPDVSNADLARDVLDLTFSLESGRRLDVFTRFDTPIRVRAVGRAGPTFARDLGRVVDRLRREAGLDIRMSRDAGAEITVQAVPRAEIRSHLPQAACFVVPNVSSLAEYANARRTSQVSWSKLTARHRAAVFVPSDTSPQEVRDCLHEELAQALGPLNDLYRLPDSVFNDDNVHTVLTGYDMLVLRVLYDSDLRSGMTRAQVAERLPAILARVNPAGEGRPATALRPTPRSWVEAVQTALGPGAGNDARLAAARRGVQIAESLDWQDHRRGFSHYALGRILQGRDPDAAQAQFLAADRIFASSPRTRLHRAYVAAQIAAHDIARGRPEDALARIEPNLDIAARHENAALLSTLMLLRAEALDLTGRTDAGRAVRLDSLGWARYGFGADWAVRAKLREITALNPLKGGLGRS